MLKFKPSFDKDAITQWLNEMSKQGYAMTGFFAGIFVFEECTPGKYIYQVDFGNKFFSVAEDYREFMNDANVEIVQSWGYWIYLRKLASDGNFTLYTDVDSSIEHYKKILKMFKFAAILEIIFFCICATLVNYNSATSIWATITTGILAIAVFRAAFRTRRKLEELLERKGECLTYNNRRVSPLIPIAFLINAITLIIHELLPTPVKGCILIIVIILLAIGFFQSRNVFHE